MTLVMTTPLYALSTHAKEPRRAFGQSKNKIFHQQCHQFGQGGTTGIVAAATESGLETVAFDA
jgi:hypothetical protein